MTDDLQDLERESAALARERADTRTPAIVRRAFLQACAVTPRRYMQLEEIGSPLLCGEWPWEDPAAMSQAFCESYAVLFPDREIPPPSDLAKGLIEMISEVRRAFDGYMPMRSPSIPGVAQQAVTSDGIGWMARILAYAYKNGLPEPLDMPLDRLFVLTASAAACDGKECAGSDYRDRNVSESGNADRIAVAEQPDQQGTQEGRRQGDDADGVEQGSGHPATGHVVDAGNQQTELRGDAHVENVP